MITFEYSVNSVNPSKKAPGCVSSIHNLRFTIWNDSLDFLCYKEFTIKLRRRKVKTYQVLVAWQGDGVR
jgi:hypothetical protein